MTPKRFTTSRNLELVLIVLPVGGRGAALELLTVEESKPKSFASRFKNFNEEFSSIYDLEMLGVVCPIEYF